MWTGRSLCASVAPRRVLSIRNRPRWSHTLHAVSLLPRSTKSAPSLSTFRGGRRNEEKGGGLMRLSTVVPVSSSAKPDLSLRTFGGGEMDEKEGRGPVRLSPEVPMPSVTKTDPSLSTVGGEEKDSKGEGGGLMRLSPEVPVGARCVQVRGTNRRSAIIRYLRAYTVDVNFDYRSWAVHSGPWRNVQAWSPRSLWKNSDLRRILFPDVAQVGLVAAGITYYNILCAREVWLALDTDGDGEVSVAELKAGIDSGLVEAHHIMGTDFFITSDMITIGTTIPFTLTSLALGMMLTFRTQNCSKRYNEARGVWGGIVNEGRALSSRIMSLVGSHPKDSEVARAADHAVKCIMTFSHALKYHVTTDGHCPDLIIRLDMTDAEVHEAKGVVLRQELAKVWNYDDCEERAYVDRLLAPGVANRPLHALQEISEITAQVLMKPEAEGGAGLAPQLTDSIYRSITRFQDLLGACERLYKTPIYTGATRFNSRCVWLWTNLIPLALYPIMGPIATVPSSVVVAMFMYGLEDVGARIEQPFGSLPLWQYCDGIDAGCKQTLAQHEVLKQVTR